MKTKRGAFYLLILICLILSIGLYFESTIELSSNIRENLLLTTNRSFDCIIVLNERRGRLGNRMFVLASAYSLARIHSCYLYISIDILEEIREDFHLKFQSILLTGLKYRLKLKRKLNPMKRIKKILYCEYHPDLLQQTNEILNNTIFELDGYWQIYLYFHQYKSELQEYVFHAKQHILIKLAKFFIAICQRRWKLTPKFSLNNHQLFKQQLIELNLTTWIGIHVRRGDFLALNYSSTDEYLFNSMTYFTRQYQNVSFIVVSDDKSYCKNVFRTQRNVYVTPFSFSSGDDLTILSLCQHSIITGGTFGWWAAYLANGQVIYDQVYPSTCEKPEYYYPPSFKTIRIFS